jgi:hypothetical protein
MERKHIIEHKKEKDCSRFYQHKNFIFDCFSVCNCCEILSNGTNFSLSNSFTIVVCFSEHKENFYFCKSKLVPSLSCLIKRKGRGESFKDVINYEYLLLPSKYSLPRRHFHPPQGSLRNKRLAVTDE